MGAHAGRIRGPDGGEQPDRRRGRPDRDERGDANGRDGGRHADDRRPHGARGPRRGGSCGGRGVPAPPASLLRVPVVRPAKGHMPRPPLRTVVGANRYRRQSGRPEIGPEGQRTLGRSVAVVVGLGALGSVAADLLARAGVGRLRVVDRDVVELVNLQRPTLYSEGDLDRPKAEAAAERLKAVNADIDVEGIAKDVHSASVRDLLRRADVIVDGTDNLETRFLLNEAAVDGGFPFVYGGAIATYGMVFAIRSPDTACFRCLTPKTPAPGSLPTCETAGIFNAVSAMVGAIQAGEVLRMLLGHAPSGDLLVVDGWLPDIQRIHVARRPDCRACGTKEYEFHRARRSQVLASLCCRA